MTHVLHRYGWITPNLHRCNSCVTHVCTCVVLVRVESSTSVRQKKLQASKKGMGQQPLPSVPGLKTNNYAVVVSLPPAFQGFLGTRNGRKSIIDPTGHLAKIWENLNHTNPQNPVQILSNNFMLRMCESQQYKFKSRRECETLARKEREKQIALLLALEKNTKGWTPYCKRKSIYGTVSIYNKSFQL